MQSIAISKIMKSHFSVILFLVLFLMSISNVVDSYSHIDKEEPYKSFVGRILPDRDEHTKVDNDYKKYSKSSGKNGHISKKHKEQATKAQKSSNYGIKGLGRGLTDSTKPNWYFSDPEKYLGKSILNYEPADKNEPDPSKRIKQRGVTKISNTTPKSTNSGPNAPNDPNDPNSPSGSSSTPTSPPGSSQKGGKKKLQVVDFPDSLDTDPNAPGWFALKETSDFGKKLKLGTLLRKKSGKKRNHTRIKGHSSDDPDDPSDYSTDSIEDNTIGRNTNASEEMSPINKKYDKACLYLEYKDAKSAVMPSKISEATRQIIRSQNQQLADFFLDMVFNLDIPSFDNHPLTKQKPENAFGLLLLTKQIFFNEICKDKEFDEVEAKSNYNPSKDKLLPKQFVEGVYHLFLKLHSITKPSGSLEYLDNSEKMWIETYLKNCTQPGGLPKKILWHTDECKETVIAFDQENNYACTPYLEYDFNIKKYDPVLDFMWHMIASVHAHCFESFQPGIRMWHRYALAMADLFPPSMRLRWSASSEENKKLYTRLLGPNYETYFSNMNRCMYAANLRSNVPYLLPRFEGERKTRFAPYATQKFSYSTW